MLACLFQGYRYVVCRFSGVGWSYLGILLSSFQVLGCWLVLFRDFAMLNVGFRVLACRFRD